MAHDEPDPAGQRHLDLPAVEAHAERIRSNGWTIIENAVELELIDAIGEDLLRLEEDMGVVPADNAFEGRRTTRIYNLLRHGPLYEQIPLHRAVLPVVEKVLDDGLLVSSLSSIAIGPGESAQPIHCDDQLIPLPRPHPPIICNTMWAITDFTEENGATRLCPGTHLADHAPDLRVQHDSVPAVMERGSVLVWVGSLWHGGGANTTDAPRVGIAMNYCAGWMRQQENQQLGIPLDTVRGFSSRLQELCGFSIYHGLVGHIEKEHPRKRLLGDAARASLVWDPVVEAADTT